MESWKNQKTKPLLRLFPPEASFPGDLTQRPACLIDELWTYCRKKKLKVWFFVAYDVAKRKVIAIQDGSRTNQTIRKLYEQLPEKYRDSAQFYTDYWYGFRKMLPRERLTQTKKYTYLIESVFSAVRQRANRLVRQTVGYSKSRCHHTEAVKFAFATFNKRDS